MKIKAYRLQGNTWLLVDPVGDEGQATVTAKDERGIKAQLADVAVITYGWHRPEIVLMSGRPPLNAARNAKFKVGDKVKYTGRDALVYGKTGSVGTVKYVDNVFFGGKCPLYEVEFPESPGDTDTISEERLRLANAARNAYAVDKKGRPIKSGMMLKDDDGDKFYVERVLRGNVVEDEWGNQHLETNRWAEIVQNAARSRNAVVQKALNATGDRRDYYVVDEFGNAADGSKTPLPFDRASELFLKLTGSKSGNGKWGIIRRGEPASRARDWYGNIVSWNADTSVLRETAVNANASRVFKPGEKVAWEYLDGDGDSGVVVADKGSFVEVKLQDGSIAKPAKMIITSNASRTTNAIVAKALNACTARNGYVVLRTASGGTGRVYEGEEVEFDGKTYTAKALGSPQLDKATLVDGAGNKIVVQLRDTRLKAANATARNAGRFELVERNMGRSFGVYDSATSGYIADDISLRDALRILKSKGETVEQAKKDLDWVSPDAIDKLW